MIKNLMIDLYPSNHCNRHCPECYWQGHIGAMSDETIDAVAHWIGKTCTDHGVQGLHLSFLGGEPTIRPERTFRLFDRIREVLPVFTGDYHDGGGVGAMLYTNGDFLSPELLQEIKKRRIWVRLNPAYDDIPEVERKVFTVKTHLGGCGLAVALDDLNMNRLPELARLVVKHAITIRINRLYCGGIIPGYVDQYREQMTKLFQIFLEAENPPWPNWIMESTLPLWKGPKNPALCGRSFLAIDVDGSIRSCNADPETVMGNVRTNRFEDLKFTHRWTGKNFFECQMCEWVLWCQGGCPYTRKLAFGTYQHKSPFCRAFKVLFPMLMELTRKWEAYHCRRNHEIQIDEIQLPSRL